MLLRILHLHFWGKIATWAILFDVHHKMALRNVVLASTSAIKIAAAKMAGYEVIAAVPASDDSRPAQPIYRIAMSSDLILSRINAAVRAGTPITTGRYWMIIENVACVFEDSYNDEAFVIVFDTWTGLMAVGVSSKLVGIPAEYVKHFKSREHERLPDWTFGRAAVEVEAALGNKVEHNDWFGGSLVKSPYPSRLHQIVDAINHVDTNVVTKYEKYSDAIASKCVYYSSHKGVPFYDVMPAFYSANELMQQQVVRVLFPYVYNKQSAKICRNLIEPYFMNDGTAVIASLASRGHLVTSLIASECAKRDIDVQIVSMFKSGAIPAGDAIAVSYKKEYGEDVLCMHKSIAADLRGKSVIVCDDILATGGTVLAAIKLLQDAGAIVKLALFIKAVTPLRDATLDAIYATGVRVATLTMHE